MHRALRWSLILLLVATLLYGGFVGYVSWKSAESLVHPDRPTFSYVPTDYGLAYESVNFTTSDGLRLSGWWMPAVTAPNASAKVGTVIFLHGYGESKNQSLLFATFLHNDSLNVLAFDFRAHGDSQGDHTTVGLDEVRDVQAAFAYVGTRADPARVALFGLSMGAATGINAAAQLPQVRAVVSDSSFATLQNIAANSITHFTHLPKYPYGPVAVFFASRIVHEDIDQNAPVRAIATVKVPVLLIQGGQDDIAIAKSDGEALHAADATSEYWFVPAAAHVKAHTVAHDEYEARVVAFLDRTLA